MKRRKPLRTTRALRPDPEKVREFMQRGRKELKRSGGIKRAVRARGPEGPLTPTEWHAAVFKASGGRCLISGARARDADDPRFHCHHPFPKDELRARGLFGRVWDPRNGVWLRADLHLQHEFGPFKLLAYPALPASVWEFCRELDELEGTEWATVTVQRAHPINSHEEAGRAEGRARDRREGEGRGSERQEQG